MKLGIVGKGGVGKTTISALISQAYAERGLRVLAIDTDSNPNLAISLGLDLQGADEVPILPRRMIVGGGDGAMTPSELVGQYGVMTPANVMLIHAMRITQAGAGWTCGSHAAVRSILGAAIDQEADVTLVDMEAGLEHLSRSGGTLAYADVLLVVMEPSRKSILTAGRTIILANELGLQRVYGVGNKARPGDEEFFAEVCAEYNVPLAGIVPENDDVAEADRSGEIMAKDQGEPVREAIQRILDFVDDALRPTESAPR